MSDAKDYFDGGLTTDGMETVEYDNRQYQMENTLAK